MDTQVYIFGIVACLCMAGQCLAENRARGFNDDITWVGYEDGLKLAKSSGKPILLLVHKTWCGACKALKPMVSTSMEMEKLSANFVMVNIEDDEEDELPGSGKDYQPDGGYIPRLMFLDSDGKLRKDIINEDGNPKYKHYYSDEHQIVAAMMRAMELMPVGERDKEL